MSYRLRGINQRILTVVLLIAILVLVVGSFLVLSDTHARLRNTFGQSIAQRAEQSAAAIDSYVFRRIIDVSLLARAPEIRAEAARGDRPANAAATAALDNRWSSLDARAPEVAAVLNTRASRYLADLTRQDPIYREILVTDREGRLVAASNVTSDYYQGDEDWWRRVMGERGRGEATVSDVRWDDSARAYAIEIAVPVPGESDDAPVGVLKLVADIREMLASVAGLPMGSTGDAMLLRRNGTIVFSRQISEPNARFFAADRLKERLDAMAQGDAAPTRLYFTAAGPDGSEQLVGVATSQLSMTYPQLPWVVAAWQAESELLAPVRAQYWMLLLVLAVTALVALAVAFLFSVRMAAPAVGTEMDLVKHPKIHRVAEDEEESEVTV
jgi:Cache domain